MSIKIKNLSHSYGNTEILRNVSHEFKTGTSTAVLGETGTGKSTLLKAIAGLLDTPSPSVTIPRALSVGFLFQQNALFDSYTCAENLEIAQLNFDRSLTEKRERANAALSSVLLEGEGDRFPSELSGGMQKRLAIARCLIAEPDILILDDPTAGLDPITSSQILQLLKKQISGKTVIWVSNSPSQARVLSADFLALRDYQLQVIQSPELAFEVARD